LDDAAIKNLSRAAEALEDYNEPFKHLAEIARIKQETLRLLDKLELHIKG
jgi:hypothetical protein